MSSAVLYNTSLSSSSSIPSDEEALLILQWIIVALFYMAFLLAVASLVLVCLRYFSLKYLPLTNRSVVDIL